VLALRRLSGLIGVKHALVAQAWACSGWRRRTWWARTRCAPFIAKTHRSNRSTGPDAAGDRRELGQDCEPARDTRVAAARNAAVRAARVPRASRRRPRCVGAPRRRAPAAARPPRAAAGLAPPGPPRATPGARRRHRPRRLARTSAEAPSRRRRAAAPSITGRARRAASVGSERYFRGSRDDATRARPQTTTATSSRRTTRSAPGSRSTSSTRVAPRPAPRSRGEPPRSQIVPSNANAPSASSAR